MADNDQIRYKPDSTVQALTAAKRINPPSHQVQSTWKVTSWAVSDDNEAEATGFDAWMKVVTEVAGKEQELWVQREVGIAARQMSVDLSSMSASDGNTYTRQSYYPMTGRELKSVTTQVRLINRIGKGEWKYATRWFQKPRKPSISALEQDAATGVVTCTITTNAGTDEYERYDTKYQVWVYNSHTKTSTVSTTASTSTSIAVSVDDPGRMALAYGEFIRVRVIAWARGYRGDSDKAQNEIYIGWPYQPTITDVDVTSTNSAAKVTALVNLNVTEQHPVTGCKLEKLVNVPYTDATQIPGDALWTSTGAVDNGSCTALATTVADIQPSAGSYSWVRVKSWNDIEGIFYRYSPPVRVTALERPVESASTGRCAILKIVPSTTGTSATVVVGWREATANTGTELSWSDSEAAWSSSTPPSTANYTNSDSTPQSSFWPNTGTFTVSSLTAGTTYYIRARRYLTGTGTTYSDYSATQSFRTETAGNDSVGIVSVTAQGDGTTAQVVVGWTENSDNDGTELTWSDDYTAWYSTSQPSKFEFTWKDSTSQSASWANTATAYITGLKKGKTYYIRARRYLGDTYSQYSKFATFMTNVDSAENDTVSIVSATPNDDGTSVTLVIGWTEDTPNDGTEISWAEKYTAWHSTSQPKTLKADWSDATSQSASYKKTATVTVEDLEPGTLYYFRARRYLGDTYSRYSAFASAIPATKPDGVELSAPGVVTVGDPLHLSWSYDAADMQTGWEIVTGTLSTVTSGGVSHYTIASSGMKVLAHGDDTMLSCSIPYAKFENSTTLPVAVRVSTGGEYVMSYAQVVKVGQVPTASVSASTLTAQPMQFSLNSSVAGSIVLVVMADGVTDERPYGEFVQTAGDSVWSIATTPTWSYSNGTYSATVTADPGLELIDGAGYAVTMRVRDGDTGLESEEASTGFAVAYTAQAPEPPDTITLTPYDTASSGVRSRGCTIALDVASDEVDYVYDVYRVTDDGVSLAAYGCADTDTVNDPYAPFGAKYRIVTRTADGVTDWRDFPYALQSNGDLRIDFGGKYVELPFSLGANENYDKGFELVRHADGSSTGRWAKGTKHDGSFSVRQMPVSGAAAIGGLKELARYQGTCWVRTRNGGAFAANVEVRNLKPDWRNVYSVSLDVTEVDSDEFAATVIPAEDE